MNVPELEVVRDYRLAKSKKKIIPDKLTSASGLFSGLCSLLLGFAGRCV